jgi:hypothetical protein
MALGAGLGYAVLKMMKLHAQPGWASSDHGIPIHYPAVFPFMWIKGIRDTGVQRYT